MDGIYTQQFNRRHRRDGTLFRGRYKAILIDADEYLAAVVRYIHLNAVEAGLAKMEMGHQQEFYPSPSTPCLGNNPLSMITESV